MEAGENRHQRVFQIGVRPHSLSFGGVHRKRVRLLRKLEPEFGLEGHPAGKNPPRHEQH